MGSYSPDDIPLEKVQAIGNYMRQPNNKPYSNTYTPAYKNHPNLSTVENPKDQCQAVTLRNDTEYDGPTVEDKGKKIEGQHVTSPAQEEVTEDLPKKKKSIYTEPAMKIPYPQWFHKANLNKQFSKFLEVFKKLTLTFPLLRKMEDYETVALTEECIAIIQKKLLQKLRDPGSFTIPCTIGNFHCERALCDLGASINLMSLSVFRVTHPRCIIEDVLVKVDKFIFPVDFIVHDMEEDEDVPIILGRPFLANG
ncbi:uncharacterized protein LOC133799699 [Humulus lupulus]|uniref:uncharacterized protein LOC133799699 n=1 Tax=Humulus lupulus TaxID=3486 RepID=UPI002B404D6D|nr:uncharacterized protein LOC133799699 [Humulus lupulus]